LRAPGRSSVRDCAPSPGNAGRVDIVTPDCRMIYPCQSSVASDKLSGAALILQRSPITGRYNESAPHGCPVRGAAALGGLRVVVLVRSVPVAPGSAMLAGVVAARREYPARRWFWVAALMIVRWR
jgi:hypothetical protein